MRHETSTRRTLSIEDYALGSGGRLPTALIRFRTSGTLSEQGDNCVVVFSYYTGTDHSYDAWIGPGRPLDPDRHFIVVVDHLGGGVSSSPSNTPGEFPQLCIGDSVRAAWLVLDSLGVRRVRLAAGWSLGGMQALEFAARYPDAVSAVFALCSAARCSEVNQVFLDSVSAALKADPKFAEGDPERPPAEGLNAFGRVYAGWAYSEEFFAGSHFRELGYRSVDDVIAQWGRDHEAFDARDLMASLGMWRAADIGHGRGGLEAALAGVVARTILMPSTTDAYFTLAENRREARALPRGELRELDSPLGHIAGRPGVREREQERVDECLRELMEHDEQPDGGRHG